jgi:hypothetical protein
MKCQVPKSLRCLTVVRSHLLRQYLSLLARFDYLQQAIGRLMRCGVEPKVWRRHDRYGNLYYRVYDPLTGISAVFGSELEVLWWLEQR